MYWVCLCRLTAFSLYFCVSLEFFIKRKDQKEKKEKERRRRKRGRRMSENMHAHILRCRKHAIYLEKKQFHITFEDEIFPTTDTAFYPIL